MTTHTNIELFLLFQWLGRVPAARLGCVHRWRGPSRIDMPTPTKATLPRSLIFNKNCTLVLRRLYYLYMCLSALLWLDIATAAANHLGHFRNRWCWWLCDSHVFFECQTIKRRKAREWQVVRLHTFEWPCADAWKSLLTGSWTHSINTTYQGLHRCALMANRLSGVRFLWWTKTDDQWRTHHTLGNIC